MIPLRHPWCLSVRKRAAGIGGWLVPGLLLVLIPKCPACFAAYVALASGIGLSLPVAAFVRWGLIVVCVGSLAYLIGSKVRRKLIGTR